MAVVPLSCLHAAESVVWDDANNKVTYTRFTDGQTLGDAETSVNLSQFSATKMDQHFGNGGLVSFTLTKAILSIDGSIYGEVWFQNNDATKTATPSFEVTQGRSWLTFGGQTTPTQYFNDGVPIGSVAPGQRVDTSVNVSATGDAVTQTYITTALAQFIGNGEITTAATVKGAGAFYVSNISGSTSGFDLLGASNVSVTYEYVPEPSTLALLGFGCTALLARRRVKRTPNTPQALI